ncbi:hypothetical protein Ddye_016814 [Dipteronia dyeriana]|uniref:RNase H type-1 domain-containing protein n=1 Tax=Dipteronia dyeriana TaxID=168575 RepID=A0AAD9U7E8_9ROSI|nr:hypothetical protein Ddye_016814 [Dipteronia dyeriana]
MGLEAVDSKYTVVEEAVTILQLNMRERCVDQSILKRSLLEEWVPPSVGRLKFNVDGSARGKPSNGGIGGVLKDASGVVLCRFSFFVRMRDSNEAEILAIHKACELHESRVALWNKEIDIISDSLVAVLWANDSKGFGNLRVVDLVYDIKTILERVGRITISYNLRNTNSYAEILSKRGSNMEGDFLIWGLGMRGR